jgi:hypothetical protein
MTQPRIAHGNGKLPMHVHYIWHNQYGYRIEF